MSQQNTVCSVVVACHGCAALLERCLASLHRQRLDRTEVVVATWLDGDELYGLRRRFPDVCFVSASRGLNFFRLRSLGVSRARGRWITLTESHCTFADGWLASIVAAHERGLVAVGGPVANGLDDHPADRALYQFEYGAMSPESERAVPSERLSAVNASYERQVLESVRAVWRFGFYENEVHDALRRQGVTLSAVRDAVAFSHLSMSLRRLVAHLFEGGRRFGRHRTAGGPFHHRLLWLLASPAVVVVLTARHFRQQQPRSLIAAAEYACLILCILAWSSGEFLGYASNVLGTTLLSRPQPRRAMRPQQPSAWNLHGTGGA